MCCLCPICFADADKGEIRVIYPLSIATQAEGYLSLFHEKYPDITIISDSENGTGDVISEVLANETSYDVVLVPDYITLEKGLMPAHITWDVRYGHCDIVLGYTNDSYYASEITPDTWYEILARDNVITGILHPDVDPKGWRSLITLKLADGYYEKPVFSTLVPEKTNISYEESDDGGMIYAINPISQEKILILNSSRDLDDAVKNGTVDYTFDYRGGVYQHNISFIDLPDEIDLSSARHEEEYWNVPVTTGNGVKHSPPIVFAASVPVNAENQETGIAFIQLIMSDEGAQIIRDLGQLPIQPAEGVGEVPPELRDMITLSS